MAKGSIIGAFTAGCPASVLLPGVGCLLTGTGHLRVDGSRWNYPAGVSAYDAFAIHDGGPSFLELIARPAWHADALCKEYPQVSFFPEQGGDTATPKAICARCIVRLDCAEASVGEKHGIWAGTAPGTRRKGYRAA